MKKLRMALVVLLILGIWMQLEAADRLMRFTDGSRFNCHLDVTTNSLATSPTGGEITTVTSSSTTVREYYRDASFTLAFHGYDLDEAGVLLRDEWGYDIKLRVYSGTSNSGTVLYSRTLNHGYNGTTVDWSYQPASSHDYIYVSVVVSRYWLWGSDDINWKRYYALIYMDSTPPVISEISHAKIVNGDSSYNNDICWYENSGTGIYYASGDVKAKATITDDRGFESGFPQYALSGGNAVSYSSTSDVEMAGEGTLYSLKFEARDIGHNVVSKNFDPDGTSLVDFYIDKSPPELPEISFSYVPDSGGPYRNVVNPQMDWTVSADHPAENSGLKGYYYSELDDGLMLGREELIRDYGYYSWYVTGDIIMEIVAQGDIPAYLFGLFVDPVEKTLYNLQTNDACFAGVDEETGGNWNGVYGSDGYLLPGDNTYQGPGVAIFLNTYNSTTEEPIQLVADPAPGQTLLADPSGVGTISDVLTNPHHFYLRIIIGDGEPRRLSLFWPRNIVSSPEVRSPEIEIREGTGPLIPSFVRHQVPLNLEELDFYPGTSTHTPSLAPESVYAIGLIPIDNVHHLPLAGNMYRWENGVLFTQPESFNIEAVDYGVPYVEEETGFPVYPVEIRFNRTRGVLKHLSEIRILYNLVGSGVETLLHSTKPEEIIADLISGGGEWSEWEAEPGGPGQDGQLVLHTALRADTGAGNLHAHQDYHFTPVYKQLYPDTSGTPIYTRGTGLNPGEAVPNLVDYHVLIDTMGESHDFKAVNTREVTTNLSGIDFDSFEVTIQEGEAVNFALESWTDAEGDLLSFDLYTINDTPLASGEGATAAYSNPYRQIMHCYLHVHEKVTAGGPDVAVTETWDHRNPYGTKGEGFYLSFEAPVAPWKFYPATERDPVYTYPAEYLFSDGGVDYRKTDTQFPVYDEEIKLGLQGATAENVYVMNFAYADFLNTFRDSEYIAVEDLKAQLDFGGIPPLSYNPAQLLYDWSLNGELEEPGKKRLVVAQFGDGNDAYYAYRMTLLDKDKPNVPANVAVELQEYAAGDMSDDEGLFSWDGEADYNYQLSYTVNGTRTVVGPLRETTLRLSLAGMGGDKPVSYELRSVGRTGQMSDPVIGTFYTPAYPGVYNDDMSASYDVAGGEADPYLEWSVENASAAGFVVKQGASEVEEAGVTSAGSNTAFKVSGLDGVSSYSFVVAAVNTDGHESLNTVTVTGSFPNFAPEGCELLTPGTFAPAGTISFSWKKAVDGNLENLTYYPEVSSDGTTYIEMGEVTEPDAGSNYTFVYTVGDPGLPPELQSGYFTDGNTYYWRVAAADVSERTNSPVRSFQVDEGAPVITAIDKPEGFSTQAELTVEIVPSLSGLSGDLKYTALAETGGTELYSGSARLVAGEGGKYTAAVPLEAHDQAYTLRVSIVSGMSETTSRDFDSIRIDRDPPQLILAEVNLPAGDEYYYTRLGEVPVTVELIDNFAGFRALQYGYSTEEGVPPASWKELPVVSGGEISLTLDAEVPHPLAEGESAKLYLRVEDNAGLISLAMATPKDIYYDATAPVNGRFSVEGFQSYNGQFYLSELAELTEIQLTGEDDLSGILDYAYALGDGGTPVWYASWEEAKTAALPLTDGGEYQLLGRIRDKAQNASTEVRVTFIADSSAPAQPFCDLDTGPTYLTGEQVSFQVASIDGETPVRGYTLRIGTAGSETLVSDLLAPANGGVLESETGAYTIVVPGVAPGVYTLILDACNAAGISSRLVMPDSLNLSNAAEALVVTSEGPYHSDTARLTGSWAYLGAEALAGYQYRINGPGYESEPWLPLEGPAQETSYRFSGLNLQAGEEYTVEVTAFYEGSLPDLVAASAPVKIDITAPAFDEAAGFVVPEACHSESLEISWLTAEPESGIASVELELEKMVLVTGTEGPEYRRETIGTVPVNLASGASGNAVIRSDGEGKTLALADGSDLFLTLRLTNGAGLTAERSAPAVKWDNSPPEAIMVIDQGKAIRADQVAGEGLRFNWLWSGADPQSGISEYLWKPVVEPQSADLTSADILADPAHTGSAGWNSLGTSGELIWDSTAYPSLVLPAHSDRCFVLVKAVNNVGLETLGCSNGIDVDADGPLVSEVKLLTGTDTTRPDTRYLNANSGLYLFIDAFDTTDIDEYKGRYGVPGTDGEFVEWGVYNGTMDLLALGSNAQEWPVLPEGEVVYFEGSCINSLDLESEPRETGLTGGVMLETTLPELKYVTGELTGRELIFNWRCKEDVTMAPVASYSLELWPMQNPGTGYVKGAEKRELAGYSLGNYTGDSLAINLDAYRSQPGLTPEEELPDGAYALFVRAETAAGNISVEKMSGIVIVDTTPPELEVTITTTDRGNLYAYDKLTLHFAASDQPAPAEIAGYEYAIGSLGDDDLYTTGWEVLESTDPAAEWEVDLTGLATAFEDIPDGAAMYVRARVKDRVPDQWSVIVTAGPVIIDKTPADVQGPHLENSYNDSLSLVRHLQFSIVDEESGVAAYRTAVVPDADSVSLDEALADPGRWKTVAVDVPANSKVVGEGYSYTTPVVYTTAASGDTAYVVVQILNETGQWSPAYYSPLVTFDTEKPAVSFSEGSNGVLRIIGEEEEFVYNTAPLSLNFTPDDLVSPELKVELNLVNASGETVETETYGYGDCTPGAARLFEYASLAPGSYEDYALHLTIWDRAGNDLLVIEPLRVNDPPVIQFGTIETTPGRPFNLAAGITDEDNAERGYEYLWEWSSPGDVRMLGSFDAEVALPLVRLLHAGDDTAQESTYGLRLRVTDADGGISVEPVDVHVYNTREGQLYYHETWRGSHEITGDIEVPACTEYSGEALVLTVASGTDVEVRPSADGYRLTVMGSLNTGAGSRFTLADAVEPAWDGIRVAGSVQLDGTTIEHAFRGLTILPGADVVFLGSNHFDNNKTGIHVLKEGQQIVGVSLAGNTYYGIKEEGVMALITGCLFSGNRIHYHTRENTRITIDQLNARAGSDGNLEQ